MLLADRMLYLLRSALLTAIHSDNSCPHCGATGTVLVRQKWLVTSLLECSSCGLRYRYPKDSIRSNWFFYQTRYSEGLTTDLPDAERLQQMLQQGFGQKDFTSRIELLRAVKPTGRLLDFGSSWGYGAYQLAQAGYTVTAFEISQPRAEFAAKHLGLQVIKDYASLERERV